MATSPSTMITTQTASTQHPYPEPARVNHVAYALAVQLAGYLPRQLEAVKSANDQQPKAASLTAPRPVSLALLSRLAFGSRLPVTPRWRFARRS